MPDPRYSEKRQRSIRATSLALALALLLVACSSRDTTSSITDICREGVVPPALSTRPLSPREVINDARDNAKSFKQDRLIVTSLRDLDDLKKCLEVEKSRLQATKLNLEIRNAVRDLSGPGVLNIIFQNFAILAGILGASAAVWRYFDEKRKSREESQNARFEGIVGALGSEVPEARIGASALLATFLENEYNRFFVPVFKLTVGYLVPDDSSTESKRSSPVRRRAIDGADWKSTTVDPLDQMLASVLKTAYPLALVRLVRERDSHDRANFWSRWRSKTVHALSVQHLWSSDEFLNALKRHGKLLFAKEQASRTLDAEGIILDGVYLASAAFPCGWFRKASFRGIDGTGINFAEARLSRANFSRAELKDAQFSGAVMEEADFSSANLEHANFSKVDGKSCKFRKAKLARAEFSYADLDGADFSDADFTDLNNVSESTIQFARSLKGTNLRNAKGLTAHQIDRCRAMGAINLPDAKAEGGSSSLFEP